MNFSNKNCLLCLEYHDNSFEIFGKQGIDLNIGVILQQHFWFEVDTFAAKNICEVCWQKVESFHIFYNFVKSIHQQQAEPRSEQTCETKTTYDELVHSIKEEQIDIKDFFHDFNDIIEYIDSPGPSDDLEVEKNYAKGSNTVARTTLKSKRMRSAFSDNADRPTARDPVTEPLKKRTYICKTSKINERISKSKTQTELLSQYFDMSCDRCDTLLSSFEDTKNHYKDVHGVAKGYLICCNRKYIRLTHMLSHCEWHMNPDAFNCSQCSRNFHDKYKLQEHMSFVHAPDDKKIFNCNDCDKKFSKKYFLTAHQKLMHNLSLKCPICQVSGFHSKLSVRYHIREVHSREDELELRSKKKSEMKVYGVMKGSMPFECDICGFRSGTLSRLKIHIQRVHVECTPAYYHICEICAKPFTTGQAYQYHYERVHMNQSKKVLEKVQCDICGNWFANKRGLLRHFITHNGKPATCKICGRVASNRVSLRGHTLRVHREASLECKICGRMFKHKKVFTEHMAMHYGITDLYTCKFCTKTFRSNANMYSHRKRAHPVELEKLKKNCKRNL